MKDIKIDIIDNFETFQAIKNNWESVYKADIYAQLFLSWIWFSGMLQWYKKSNQSWLILAAKSSTNTSEYVGFFPLLIAIDEHPSGGFYSKLSMAGVADSEHIGFICLPEYEEAVSFAFAKFIKQQQEEWSIFEVDNILATDGRMSLLLKEFSGEDFELQEHFHTNDFDNIDNNIVPYISLPSSFEEYLQNVVSSNTRQKIRRFLRRIEGSNEFHLTHVNADNLELHLEILSELWKLNWEGRKGSDRCRKILDKINFTLRNCFSHQCLYLPVLWQGDKPLGAIANLMDFSHKTMLFFITGRDDTVKNIAPGNILHAYSIKYAIDNGFKVYDFLMGNEAYKFSFGASSRQIKIVAIQRQNLNKQNQPLNVRTLPEAFDICVHYQRTNQLDKAERGYRQILQGQPQHSEALYRLGVVMQRKGDYQAALDLFGKLLLFQPQYIKAWFSLGNLYQIQGQLSEAEKVYRQALTLQPESSTITAAIYHNLGYALQQQDKWEEAIACYEQASSLQPDSTEALVIWANALYARSNLPQEEQAHYAALNYDLGNNRKQAGDLNSAIEYYRQSIKMNPDLASPHYHLGTILHEQGNVQGAIACYQKAQELEPDYIEADLDLANALYFLGKLPLEKQAYYAALNDDFGSKSGEVGDLQGAIEYYRYSIAMNPEVASVQYHLGLALHSFGNFEDATACYQKAQELQPDYIEAELALADILLQQDKLSQEDQIRYATINYDLGNTHQEAGNLRSAIKYYRQAITLQPDWAEPRDRLRLALQVEENITIKVSSARTENNVY
jgi:tetratricopeptide (TPR) repeat protein